MPIWDSDTRYPAPEAFELPSFIEGVPTQAEFDAQPRLYTWGELKDVIKSGKLDRLTRNKQLQFVYEGWMKKQQDTWGTTENYLINARLPWGEANRNRLGAETGPEPTYDQRTVLSHPEVDLVPSTRPRDDGAALKHRRVISSESGAGGVAVVQRALRIAPGFGGVSPRTTTEMPGGFAAAAAGCSRVATAASSGVSHAGSGVSTPNSVAYVDLDSVLPKVNKRLEKARRREQGLMSDDGTPSPEEAEEEDDLDIYLKYDPSAGLDGTKYALLPNDWPYCVPYGVRHYCVWSRVPIAHPVLVNYDRGAWEKIEAEGLGGFTGVIPAFPPTRKQLPTPSPSPDDEEKPVGRSGPSEAGEGGWYAVDVGYAGPEVKRWSGVEYEAAGGHEVANMVRGLFDPRGWETIFFVNPPRLQSVPGYAHFHIFARRKTPTEIDISEKVWGDRGTKLVG
ncbi:hypothetical protein CspeluHIS016_0101170 [Cutaneotrichosporon spelunceum]|uniref:Uncharacterized protein n=1 Tax=Cutaneotrichosporon spelunceum TaxID=1672016 RepID=A0AAD3TM30_9TREE|nr:hypothetical protein CspeluHIS016_0101170 [Cutaneotrichosporon spelunceum]